MLLSEHPSPTRTHRRILFAAWLGWLSVFSTLIAFFQLSLLYRVDLGLDDHGVSAVKSATLAATGAGGLLFGMLADRVGRRSIMMVSILVYAVGALVAAFAQTGGHMTAAAALAGLGIGGQWAAGQTLLGETVPPRLRGRFGALAQTGAPIGLALATVVATLLAPRLGWRGGFGLFALPALLVPWLPRFLPESDLWRAHRAAVGPRTELGIGDLLASGVRGAFALAFVLTLFNMANYWLTFSWLPEYLGRHWGLTIQKTGTWTLVFVAGSLIGYLLFGVCSDRWGRRLSFTLFSLVMALGLAMITWFQAPIRERPELVLLFLFVAGVGTGTWSHFGPFYAELFPTRVRNTGAGVCMNVSRGIQFVAPLLVVAVGGESLGNGIALAALFALAAGAWVWLLPETRGMTLAVDPPGR